MSTARDLRLVTASGTDPTLITELFHRVNRIVPEDQKVLTIPPATKAGDALKLMAEHHYSQLPVVAGNSVLGMFSYRSFALGASAIQGQREAPEELPVDEFLKKIPFARITDEFGPLIGDLEMYDAVLVGDPERLQCLLTPMDVLCYLYRVASAFVLLEEIELALRALIRRAVTEEELADCIKASLSHQYAEGKKLPTRLEEMTFNDYRQVVCHGDNWDKFEPAFGGTRERTGARLKPVCDLRNDVFHFRREITLEDHQTLADCRDWLLVKARVVEAREKEGRHD